MILDDGIMKTLRWLSRPCEVGIKAQQRDLKSISWFLKFLFICSLIFTWRKIKKEKFLNSLSFLDSCDFYTKYSKHYTFWGRLVLNYLHSITLIYPIEKFAFIALSREALRRDNHVSRQRKSSLQERILWILTTNVDMNSSFPSFLLQWYFYLNLSRKVFATIWLWL